MSLRARLLIGTALIAVVLGVAAFAIARTTRANLIDQVDTQLQSAGPQLGGGPGGGPGGSGGGGPRLSNFYLGVISASGNLITRAAPELIGAVAPEPILDDGAVEALRAGRIVTVRSDDPDIDYRMQARVEGDDAITVLALPLDGVDEAVQRLIAVEAASVLAVLAVLGLAMWWVIHLGVRPVQRMTETAGAIAAGDLSRRVPEGAAGTEAGALGVALNGMLGRIEEAFDQRAASEARLRQFVADASHELRTPVATIRGYAELYRTGAGWGRWSTTCCTWRGSTRAAPWSGRPWTWGGWPTTPCRTRWRSNPRAPCGPWPRSRRWCSVTRLDSTRWWPTSWPTRSCTRPGRPSRCACAPRVGTPSSRWPTRVQG